MFCFKATLIGNLKKLDQFEVEKDVFSGFLVSMSAKIKQHYAIRVYLSTFLKRKSEIRNTEQKLSKNKTRIK